MCAASGESFWNREAHGWLAGDYLKRLRLTVTQNGYSGNAGNMSQITYIVGLWGKISF